MSLADELKRLTVRVAQEIVKRGTPPGGQPGQLLTKTQTDDHVCQWLTPGTGPRPLWHGLCAWSDDPRLITTTIYPEPNNIRGAYAHADKPLASGSTATMYLEQTTSGFIVSSGWVGVYRFNGNNWQQVAVSADVGNSLTSTGFKSVSLPLTADINIGDQLYLCLLVRASIAPRFRAAPATDWTSRLPGPKMRISRSNQNALPATLELANYTNADQAPMLVFG